MLMQVGVGMCMEGIEHNPIVYELMSEMAFRKEKVKINVMLFICYYALYNY
jgi:alpha-N-acetylglucosaminidase